jgi:osmoprotectant transport system permease protein
MYQAVAHDGVDLITAYTTDGRISAMDLTVLEDDRHAIPPYDAIILASGRVAQEHPEVLRALRPLIGAINADEMRAMNFEVDEGQKQPRAVAAEFRKNSLSPTP